ncbi:ABC transporter ATP-binding protein [Plastorhodobacter daqingensis]|uniref:ABC transporter ATP-binding protein n=1 Tax=Plastorhodobacter daqingensis TaxID=1387281 RepID=A0ABW2UH10_9RHOB
MSTAPSATEGRMLGWVWRNYLKRRMPFLVVALLLMTVEGSMLGALSYLMQPMFDDVFIAGDSAAVYWVAIAISGVFILRASAAFCHRVLMSWLGERVTAEVQSDLLRHLMTLDQSFFQVHSPGNLIERVRGDSGAIRQIYSGVIAAFGRDFVALVSLLAVTLYIDWRWTLVAAIGTPLLIIPIVALQRLVRRTSRAARAAAAQNSTRLDEIFHGITTIQLTGSEDREAGRFGRSVNQFVRAQLRAEAGSAGIPALIDLVAAIGFAGVLTYGGMQIIGGEKTVGEFMAFFTAMALVFDPLRRLGGVSAALQAAMASVERMYGILQTPPAITSPQPPRAPLPLRSETRIEIDNVTFAYGVDPVLRDTRFIAEAGQTTALVGPSGAGKTTIFTLLTRLADPQAGAVRIGGHDIRDMDLKGLRGLFSVVSQDAALFDETIRDNILLGRSDISQARLEAVLEAAHVSEFLSHMPQGLDTPAGPRGSGLSGGQRQRVAIARALLRDAPILLLDEATSALDAQSEALVQSALDRLSAGRTTLVIAHRLATVRDAHKIVVMERGQVVQQGTHAGLLAEGGLYADLHRLQFKTEV